MARNFYEVRFDYEHVRGGELVEDTGYVQAQPGSDEWLMYVRYPVEGEFYYAWIPESNLAKTAPPDAWLAPPAR